MNEKIDNKDEILDRIVADYTKRIRAGKAPEIAKYKRKFPAIADEIDDLLTSVAMIEGLKLDAGQGDTLALKGSNKDFPNLKQLGDYVLIREVGRGGMGVVFEAVHQSLGRRVALKVMLEREFESERQIARFRREAQAAARLHHTNIVSVFGVGEADGFHFYVMEYVDGISLKSAVQSLTSSVSAQKKTGTVTDGDRVTVEDRTAETGDFSIVSSSLKSTLGATASGNSALPHPDFKNRSQRYQWVADIGAQVADALAYSHQMGILHRDIKPANLMLDDKGQVWITDFGLVKLNDEEAITKTGDVIGTPQYLSPESLKGEYDQRSETYCLGLSLYELATLKPAIEPGSHAQVFNRIIHEEPAAPSVADPAIPRDLGTIIAKAISKDPVQRYVSADALRDDLRAFAEDRPIAARRPSLFEQASRWSRKNPMVASLAALSAILVCATAIVASSAWAYTNQAYGELEIEATRTENALQLAEQRKKQAIKSRNLAESNVEFMVRAFDGMFTEFLKNQTNGKTKFDFDGFDELAGIEISIDAKDADYLKKVAGYYQEFAKKNADNENLLGEAAKAWRRVANVNFLIGDSTDALKSYEKSVRGYMKILEQNPDSIDALLDLVDTRSEMSNAVRRAGGFAGITKPLSLINENITVIENHPKFSATEVQYSLAKTLSASASAEVCRLAAEMEVDWDQVDRPNKNQNRGNLSGRGKKGRAGYDAKVRKNVEQAVSIAEKLVEEDKSNRKFQTLLAKSHCSLGALLASSGQLDQAKESLTFAVEQFRQLSKKSPQDADLQYQLAIALLLIPANELSAVTLENLDLAQQIASSLSARNPNPEYRQLEIVSHLKLSDWYQANQEPRESIQQMTKAADLVLGSNLKGMALWSMVRTIMFSSRQISRDLSPADREEFLKSMQRIREKHGKENRGQRQRQLGRRGQRDGFDGKTFDPRRNQGPPPSGSKRRTWQQ